MEEVSILVSTKLKLGVAESYTVFDPTIIEHINAAFSRLFTLGIGPPGGFFITDILDEWSDIGLSDTILNTVKSHVGLFVRLLFDIPTTSFTQTMMQNQIDRYEWILTTMRDDELHPPRTEEPV